jgi:aminocarboxymuconate-semialdehyde decarboxylase
MKIDSHAHYVDRDYIRELVKLMKLETEKTPQGQTLLRRGGTTVAWYKEEHFDPAERLAKMDATDVQARVLSLTSPSIYEWPFAEQPAIARQANDALVAYCGAHPGRFFALAVLPWGDADAALKELDRAIDSLGAVGIAIGSHIQGMPLNHPDFEPVWAAIDKRRVPVVLHPMEPLGAAHLNEFELPIRVGFIYETTTAVTRMIYGGVFERYPNFPFVLPHTGGALLSMLERLDVGYRLFPDCRAHINRLPSEYAKKLFYDTCSFYGPTLRLALEVVGPGQLLWGTDDPLVSASSEHVEQLKLPVQQQQDILGRTAEKVFGLKRTAVQ